MMHTRRFAGMGFAGMLLAGAIALLPARGDTVMPALNTSTNFRGEIIRPIDNDSFYAASTLRLTNWVAYAGETTNGAVQGLSGVTVLLTVGQSGGATTTYTGRVDVAASGKWSCDITVPTNSGTLYVQTQLTDTNGTVFIYPWKTLPSRSPL